MPAAGSRLDTCAKHGVETRLHCAECGKPICLRCQVRTAVGLKCEECAAQPATAVRRRRAGSGAVMAGGLGVLSLVGLLVAALLLRAAPPAKPALPAPLGAWSAVTDLPGIRGGTSSAVLRDGTILVAGGGVGSIPLDGADIFEPGSGRWTPTGSLHEARRGHGMALLSDGRVLVAGGLAGSTILSSVEIYDPGSRAWFVTAPMLTPRLGCTLTVLGDGRVLAAGGITGSGGQLAASPSAELFDPRTAVWAAVSPMLSARQEAAASLLKDGRVLIEGGLSGPASDSPVLAGAELFDPVVGVFTRTGSLPAARHGQTATVLADGRVLVAGGSGTGSNLLPAELFDAGSGTWRATGSLHTGRHLAAAALLSDGRVLIAGGESAQNVARSSLRSAEVYDPAGGRWSRAADMSCPRSNLALAPLPRGGALAAGGDAAFPGEPPKAQSCAETFRI